MTGELTLPLESFLIKYRLAGPCSRSIWTTMLTRPVEPIFSISFMSETPKLSRLLSALRNTMIVQSATARAGDETRPEINMTIPRITAREKRFKKTTS